MAKKATKRRAASNYRPSGRVPRKEPYDCGRVSAVVDRLREQAGRLNQLARSMEEAGVDDVVVDGRRIYCKRETGRFPTHDEVLAQLI